MNEAVKFLYFAILFFALIDASRGQACDSLLSDRGTIENEGYPRPGYPSYFDCEWTIQANDYDIVDMAFKDFNIEPGETCEFDSLEITAMGRSEKFCGDSLSKLPNNGRLRYRGRVVLKMTSDDSVNLRGISLNFQVTPGEPPTTTPVPVTTPPPSTTPTAPTPAPVVTCKDNPCQNGGECTMVDETEFYCFCEEGFTGRQCETNIDDCASNPCENGGTCIDGIRSWSCECIEGYLGETCGIDFDECRTDPCKNGGTCEDRLNAFNCICVKGWTGFDCSTEIDECTPNPCKNYGVCEDHIGYHTCICHPKYTGENCTIPVEEPTSPPPPVVEPTTQPFEKVVVSTTLPNEEVLFTTTVITTTLSSTTATTAVTERATTTQATTALTTPSPTLTDPVIDRTEPSETPGEEPQDYPKNNFPAKDDAKPENEEPDEDPTESTEAVLPTDPSTASTIIETPTATTIDKLPSNSTTSPEEKEGSDDSLSEKPTNNTTTLPNGDTESEEEKGFFSKTLVATLASVGAVAGILGSVLYFCKSSLHHHKVRPSKSGPAVRSGELLKQNIISPTSIDSGISIDAGNQLQGIKDKSSVEGLMREHCPQEELLNSHEQNKAKPYTVALNSCKSMGDNPFKNEPIDSNVAKNKGSLFVGNSEKSLEMNKSPDKVRKRKKRKEKNSSLTTAPNKIPIAFSPKPSPIPSVIQLPPLREDIRTKNNCKDCTNLPPLSVSSPKYSNITPEVTLFSFTDKSKGNAKPTRRKRKVANRTKGARPKTTMVMQEQEVSFEKCYNRQSSTKIPTFWEANPSLHKTISSGVNTSQILHPPPESLKPTYNFSQHSLSPTQSSDSIYPRHAAGLTQSSSTQEKSKKEPIFFAELQSKKHSPFRAESNYNLFNITSKFPMQPLSTTQESQPQFLHRQPSSRPNLSPRQRLSTSNTLPGGGSSEYTIDDAFESRSPSSLSRSGVLSPIPFKPVVNFDFRKHKKVSRKKN